MDDGRREGVVGREVWEGGVAKRCGREVWDVWEVWVEGVGVKCSSAMWTPSK